MAGDRLRHWGTGGLVLLSVAAFAATLPNAFVWDDLYGIVRNPWIRTPSGLVQAFTHHLAGFVAGVRTSYYRPLMHVCYAACYALFGLRPWGYHLLNIAVHAGTTVAVFALSRRVAPARGPGPATTCAALAAAALFAVHPVHADTVAWLGGITDLACAALSLVTLLLLFDERGISGPRRALGATCFFLALLAKEPALMTWPVLAAAMWSRGDFGPARRRGAWLSMAALATASAVYFALRIAALGGLTGGDTRIRLSAAAMLLTAAALFGQYAWKLVVPVHLSAIHDVAVASSVIDGRVLLGAVVMLVAIAALWRWRGRPEIVMGLALTVLPILPALYVAGLSESLFSERYLYLPSAGAALLVSSALVPVFERRRAALPAAAAVLVVVVAALAATVVRDRTWRDAVSLWSDAVDKYPRSAAAHEYLGAAWLAAGDAARAAQELAGALALDPRREDARLNLAAADCLLDRPDDALREAGVVLAADPGRAEAYAVQGDALARTGAFDRARDAFVRALRLDPGLGGAHFGLGLIFAATGHRPDAERELQEAVRLEPGNARYERALAMVRGQ